jgi:molecular chaperone HtpG
MLSAFAEEIRQSRSTLYINWRNPLIQRLAGLDDPERVRVCLEILYVQALLTGRFPMQGNEMALLNDNLIRLIEWGTM